MNAVEMRALRKICGVSITDRIRNVVIRDECELETDVLGKIRKSTLRWFGHVEQMNEGRLTKQIYNANVDGARSRGRPRKV